MYRTIGSVTLTLAIQEATMLPMFLLTSRTKALAAVITAATASVVFAGAAPHAHASGCAPVAHTPSVSGGLGFAYAVGFAYADLPCSGAYTIRLVNNAGNTIGAPYSDNGGGGVQTATTSCAGAIVHTFIYVNVNGVGMSDTSGTVQC